MRTTMQTLDQSLLNNLNSITTRMNNLTDQISSGSKMSTISDDPVSLVGALGLRTNLAQIQQYQSNLTYGNNMVGSAENALTQIKNLIMQAKTLATQAANSTLTQSDRTAMASQVQTLFQQALTLSNTQVEGKYIFGGQKTTGYTQDEPTPFVQGQMDGIQVTGNTPDTINNYLNGKIATNGTATLNPGDLLINGQDVVSLYDRQLQTTPNTFTYAVSAGNLADGDLLINNNNVGPVDLGSATDVANGFGLDMKGAANLKAAIDSNSTINPPVQASLTTLYAGEAAQAGGSSSTISFDLNGVTVTAKTNGTSANQVAQDVVTAVNAVSDQTGVTAAVGTGSNGGAANSIVFQNDPPGDESPITIANLSEPLGNSTGLTEGTYQADSTHNTGQITLLSSDGTGIDVSTPNDTTPPATLGLIGMASYYTGSYPITLPSSAIDLTQADTNGLYMQSAYNLQQILNNSTVQGQTGVTAKMTTLYAAGPATADTADGTDSSISFDLNNVHIAVDIPDGSSAAQVASSVVAGINAASEYTGVTAAVGDGTNGGPSGQIVLRNTQAGDESDIVIANLNEPDTAKSGLADGAHAVGATANTGELAYTSSGGITFSSSNYATNDTILNDLGLGGGGIGFNDAAGDDILEYGAPLDNGQLSINGIAIGASSADGLSDVYADSSAAAKAAAINAQTAETGVTAVVNPLSLSAQGTVEEGVLAAGDLVINGVDIFGSGSGNLTTLYSDSAASAAGTDSQISFTLNGYSVDVQASAGSSAAQVAQDAVDAINQSSQNTGVEAYVGDGTNGGPVNAVVFRNTQPGDTTAIQVSNYQVNSGTDVLGFNNFSSTTSYGIISAQDQDNSLVNAINNLSSQTGVAASRDASGTLLLTTEDGRNLHIQTSGPGEKVTHLNGGDPAAPQDKVYFGSLQLQSSQQFLLQTEDGTDGALNSLGLGGGGFQTDDAAGDGTLLVHSATQQDGAVRYTGDRDGNLQVQIGTTSNLAISQNGVNAILDTGVFSALTNFENYLQGQSFHQVTGSSQATDATAKLGSGNTGLTNADQVTAGSFSVTIMDNSASPPSRSFSIPVNPSEDSLSDVAAKLNGLPGLQASVNDSGQMEIATTDPSRYSFTLGNDTSNFLSVTGLSSDDMQVSAANQSMQDFDNAMNALTNNVSDVAATANRITAQNGILTNLQTSTTQDLSKKQDTDMAQALMDLNSTQVAYQAALAAASKTMQMSLVDFLK